MNTSNQELTPSEAADLTGYSVGHVQWLARQGKVKARRIGARVLLIDAESLEAYKAEADRLGAQKYSPTRRGGD